MKKIVIGLSVTVVVLLGVIVGLMSKGSSSDSKFELPKPDPHLSTKFNIIPDLSRQGCRDEDNLVILEEFDIPERGGMIHLTVYDLGNAKAVFNERCASCKGTGNCSSCYGQGQEYNPYTGQWSVCALCGGNGRCIFCDATGIKSGFPEYFSSSEAEAYLDQKRVPRRRERSQSAQGRSSSGGNYGGSSGSSYGGGSMYSGSSSDDWETDIDVSTTDEEKYPEYKVEGVDVKEYAPNYTGEYTEEWCSECQSMGPPHTHVKKMY